tara:strand:+ start:742 stop:1206 length:465 start_codon:yes stop_codon:yes gene_type:complete
MNKGAEILISRMQSNPEEFEGEGEAGFSKWDRVLNMASRCISEEDTEALKSALRVIKQGEFTKIVMGVLLDEPKQREIPLTGFGAVGAGAVIRTGTGLMNPIQNPYNQNIQNQQLQNQQLQSQSNYSNPKHTPTLAEKLGAKFEALTSKLSNKP